MVLDEKNKTFNSGNFGEFGLQSYGEAPMGVTNGNEESVMPPQFEKPMSVTEVRNPEMQGDVTTVSGMPSLTQVKQLPR